MIILSPLLYLLGAGPAWFPSVTPAPQAAILTDTALPPPLGAGKALPTDLNLLDTSIAEITRLFEAEELSSETLVAAYLGQSQAGPSLKEKH